MRLWLRTHCGQRLSYSQKDIDNGREELSFKGVEDAFIAYFFGADLAPTVMDNVELTVFAEDFSELVAIGTGGTAVALDFLGNN
jgi:hypothetical protein